MDSGKENGNYYNSGVILGVYMDSEKEKGNYYNMGSILGLCILGITRSGLDCFTLEFVLLGWGPSTMEYSP